MKTKLFNTQPQTAKENRLLSNWTPRKAEDIPPRALGPTEDNGDQPTGPAGLPEQSETPEQFREKIKLKIQQVKDRIKSLIPHEGVQQNQEFNTRARSFLTIIINLEKLLNESKDLGVYPESPESQQLLADFNAELDQFTEAKTHEDLERPASSPELAPYYKYTATNHNLVTITEGTDEKIYHVDAPEGTTLSSAPDPELGGFDKCIEVTIGTQRGRFQLDPQTNKFKTMTSDNESINLFTTHAIKLDQNGTTIVIAPKAPDAAAPAQTSAPTASPTATLASAPAAPAADSSPSPVPPTTETPTEPAPRETLAASDYQYETAQDYKSFTFKNGNSEKKYPVTAPEGTTLSAKNDSRLNGLGNHIEVTLGNQKGYFEWDHQTGIFAAIGDDERDGFKNLLQTHNIRFQNGNMVIAPIGSTPETPPPISTAPAVAKAQSGDAPATNEATADDEDASGEDRVATTDREQIATTDAIPEAPKEFKMAIANNKLTVTPEGEPPQTYDITYPDGKTVTTRINDKKVYFTIDSQYVGMIDFENPTRPAGWNYYYGEEYYVSWVKPTGSNNGTITIKNEPKNDNEIVKEIAKIEDWGEKNKNGFEQARRFARKQNDDGSYEYCIKRTGSEEFEWLQPYTVENDAAGKSTAGTNDEKRIYNNGNTSTGKFDKETGRLLKGTKDQPNNQRKTTAGHFNPKTGNLLFGQITFRNGAIHEGRFDDSEALIDGEITDAKGNVTRWKTKEIAISDGSLIKDSDGKWSPREYYGFVDKAADKKNWAIKPNIVHKFMTTNYEDAQPRNFFIDYALYDTDGKMIKGKYTDTKDGYIYQGNFDPQTGHLTNGRKTSPDGRIWKGEFNSENGKFSKGKIKSPDNKNWISFKSKKAALEDEDIVEKCNTCEPVEGHKFVIPPEPGIARTNFAIEPKEFPPKTTDQTTYVMNGKRLTFMTADVSKPLKTYKIQAPKAAKFTVDYEQEPFGIVVEIGNSKSKIFFDAEGKLQTSEYSAWVTPSILDKFTITPTTNTIKIEPRPTS